MIKQITNDKDIKNIAIKDNLDLKLWKHQNQKEIIKELEIIEKTKNMKKYLTTKEMNDLLFVGHLLDLSTKMACEWLEYGNLLEKEAEILNNGAEYIEQFMENVLSRMPRKEVEKFAKRSIRAKEDPIRIIDKWMQERVFGTYETEYKIVKINRPQFEKLCFVAASESCKDCNKKL